MNNNKELQTIQFCWRNFDFQHLALFVFNELVFKYDLRVLLNTLRLLEPNLLAGLTSEVLLYNSEATYKLGSRAGQIACPIPIESPRADETSEASPTFWAFLFNLG